MRRLVAWNLLAVMPIAAIIAAEGQSVSLKGHWHVDLQRSSNPYRSNTLRMTLDIFVDDGKVYEATETVVKTDGEKRTEAVRALVNGKFYPVQGSAAGISIAVTDWRPGIVRTELRTPAGLKGEQDCTLSGDSNTMVCDETDTDLQGHRTFAKAVYARD